MPSRPLTLSAILSLLLAVTAPLLAADELATLFTTPQERQLIDANRYRGDEVEPPPASDEPEQPPISPLTREEVTVEYRISGISLARDGAHTVWINAIAYEDGALLEDGSRVKIFAGDDIRVRITAPDGKQYFATSGETVSVSYLAAVEN
ncbi:MAG TPA: hypothetical protein VMZ32_09785 [Gammaproteobacteria bacterium]|nr:hypothetical protein [Gammaproteobacteria bacterium]